jgi:hypothetical protein
LSSAIGSARGWDLKYVSSDPGAAGRVSRLSCVCTQRKQAADLARFHEPYDRFVRLVARYDDFDLPALHDKD